MPHEDVLHLEKSIGDWWDQKYSQFLKKKASAMDQKFDEGLSIIKAKRGVSNAIIISK